MAWRPRRRRRTSNMELCSSLRNMVLMVLSIMSGGNNKNTMCWGEPNVPCYYIFGASYYDAGNNNVLPTLAKSNFFPYGIDFPHGPSGRFSNGRTTADFLAELLGLDRYIPSLASAGGEDIEKGINYASGGSGILPHTSTHLGVEISMEGQILNHGRIVSKIVEKIGDKEEAAKYMGKCMYSVAMGDNDYINNYFLPHLYPTSHHFNPPQFSSLLLLQYSQLLQKLYKYGARKVVIFGIPQLGCSPSEIDTNDIYGSSYSSPSPSSSSSCVNNFKNYAIQLFNNKLNAFVDDLNRNLSGAKFINVNTYDITSVSSSGFKVTNAPCCVTIMGTPTCKPKLSPCENRSEYLWWDGVHQTEAANAMVAHKSFISSSYTYPINIHQLSQL